VSKLLFPIIEVIGNQITNRNGDKSYFYKLLPPDLEQITEQETCNLYESLCNQLNFCDSESFYKFYNLDGISYLNTNDLNFELPNTELLEVNNPLEVFFGSRDIYSSVTFFEDYLSFNGKYTRVLSISSFSSDENTLAYLPNDVDYYVSFKRKETSKSLKELDRTRSAHMSNFQKNKRDIESEGAYGQAEELIYELTNGMDSLFDMEVFFLLSAFSLEELNSKAMNLITLMEQKGIKLFIEGKSVKKKKSGLATIFNSLVPGVYPKFDLRSHVNKGGHLVNLLPITRSFLQANDESNSIVTFKDINDNQIYFNPFAKELKNRNMLVSGSTGGGKSVFVNYLLHELAPNHPTVILDKRASYKRLTLYHGGSVLESGFNPMQFKDPIFLREIIISVCGVSNFSKLESGRLLKTIREVLTHNPELMDFNEFIKILEVSFKNLSLYFEEVSQFFTTDIIKASNITYVDFENYPKGVVAPLIIFILQFFKEIPEREKILVFDECWAYLKDHVEYVEECFRTFRKTGAFPIAISQGILDFNKEDQNLSNAIVNNSHLKIFFPQDYIDTHEISDFDNSRISELCLEKGKFSECYLKSSDNKFRKTLVVELDPLRVELFHTEPVDGDPMLEFISENQKYFQNTKEMIDSFVRLRHG